MASGTCSGLLQRLSSHGQASCGLQTPARPPTVRRLRRERMICSAVQTPAAPAQRDAEVLIRRRPPSGSAKQPCGIVGFEVPQTEEDKPRNILEEIIWFKALEVEDMRNRHPLPQLSLQIKLAGPPRDFIGALRASSQQTGKPGLIAEVKKASPSRGVIQPNFDHVKIAKAYEAGGAACLSVLTDNRYFQGSFDFLRDIRSAGVSCPLLCKEFIVEGYQLFRARASGADAVLLIAAVLPNKDLELLLKVVRQLSMQALIEVHTVGELERVLRLDLTGALLGINNRNLQTFKVDLYNTKTIMESSAGKQVLGRDILMVGESGIFEPADVAFVQSCGCSAILVGESLVKQGDPAAGVKSLLELH